jgi:hypothetical protein
MHITNDAREGEPSLQPSCEHESELLQPRLQQRAHRHPATETERRDHECERERADQDMDIIWAVASERRKSVQDTLANKIWIVEAAELEPSVVMGSLGRVNGRRNKRGNGTVRLG